MVDQRQDMENVARPSTLISSGDIGAALVFLILGLAVAVLPENAVRRVCRVMARAHLFFRGSKADELAHVPDLAAAGTNLRRLEQQFMTRSYEELAQPLLERRGKGWHPTIDLEGRKYIDRALADGHGAVLWLIPSFEGEIILRKALHGAEIPLADLRVPDHPYSGTRFGHRFLNPIRVEVEDRYMVERVMLHEFTDTKALQALQTQLKQNRVVYLLGSGNSEKPADLEILGGTLSLALGAPALATLSKAPLLPASVIPTSCGGYKVRIGKPMTVEGQRPGRASWLALAEAFAKELKDHVLARPDRWQGWYDRDTWVPDTDPEEKMPVEPLKPMESL